MDPKRLARYTFYAAAFFFIFFSLTGRTSMDTTFRATGLEGGGVIEERIDGIGSFSLPTIRSDVAEQHFVKKDFLFIVFYDFSLAIDPRISVPQAKNLSFDLQVPGRITTTNGRVTDSGTIRWDKLPEDGLLKASARAVRWPYVAAAIVLAGSNLYFLFRTKRATFPS